MRDGPASSNYGAAREAATPVDRPLRGRVCLVTGANRGIGKATATALARLGATVVMLARNERLLAAARDDVAQDSGNPYVSTVVADLASFADVRAAALEIATRHPALHVLVHNAAVNPRRCSLSSDGIELAFAVNHLAPFLLTHELMPSLRRGAADGGARVITVTSVFERFGRLTLDDVRTPGRRPAILAYTRSKLANVLFTYELAERLAGTGVAVNCVQPGLVATDLMREHALFRPRWLRALWSRVLLAPEAGARAAINAASAPELVGVTGQCFDRRGRRVHTSRRSRDVELRRRLWRKSAELTGAAY